MPTVFNGIGTWYYGKSRIHRRKDVCSFCQGVGELTSYDTTLYFVVLFIPLIPLSRKRILEQCPSCQKHRVLPLAQWETMKADDTARMLEQLEKDPDNRETILGALGLAVAYQDEELFDKLAGTLAQHRREDAAIQAQLGYAYSYFVRYPEAEAAYRASLAVADDPAVRHDLALVLLKQFRPDEARPYLQYIFEQRLKDEAGMIYLLVEAYQAEGMHKEALEVMDQRDAAFPELAVEKDIKKQRKTSERNLDSGRRIRSAFLTESSQAGTSEGGSGVKVAKVIGPLLLLGALAAYLGSALWIGQARKVYLVNGFDRPYTVAVNGVEHLIQPGRPTAVRVAEGEVVVESRDATVPLDSTRCQIETPFFSRPFANHTFVLNPDQLAFVLWEQTEYAETPRPVQVEPKLYVGELLHAFDGLDYEFEPFPQSVKAKKGQTVRKTRISQEANLPAEARLGLLVAVKGAEEQQAYARRWLQLDPNNVLVLFFVLRNLKDEEALAFLRPGLTARPPRVEWHRLYQEQLSKTQPEQDLRPEYQKLAAETNNHPDALYLLGRIQDTEVADEFFRKAAAATPPSSYALYALAYDALSRGQFADAAAWAEKALRLAPDNLFFRQMRQNTLLAGGKYDALLEELQRQEQQPAFNPALRADRVRALVAKGDLQGAQALIAGAVQALTDPEDAAQREALRTELDLALHCARGDLPGYLKLAATAVTERFEVALLQGKLADAAAAAGQREDGAAAELGLLYLAAHKAGDSKQADEHWQKLLDALTRADRHSRRLADILAGRKPFDAALARLLPLDPRQKRVVLAAAARRFPEPAQELLELARQLDYQRDGMSLCLRKVLE